MKQKISKVIFAAVLMAFVLAVFAACSRDDDGTVDLGDWERTSWDEPFPEQVAFTMASPSYDATRFHEGDETFYDNMWHRRWREQFNVNAEVLWVSEDYPLQINLAIAAGDIPDMFHVNAVQFAQLLEANLLEDITDVTNQWLSPALATIYEREHLVFDTAKRDGRTFALPSLSAGMTAQIPHLWVRKDWYDQAGRPEINTIADLEALMETFAQNHGTTYGTVQYNLLGNLWRSASMWHAFPRSAAPGNLMWVDDGAGGLMSGYEMPEMLDVIAGWRDWFERGIIQQDFATIDGGTHNAQIINGETGIFFGTNWIHWPISSIIDNFGPDSYFISIPMPTVDGRLVQHPVQFGNYVYHVVRRGFELPEILPILNSDYVYIMHEAPLTESIDTEMLFRFTDAHWIAGPVRVTVPHWDDTIDVVGYMNARARGESYEVTSGWALTFIDECIRWVDYQDTAGLGRWTLTGHDDSALVLAMRAQLNDQFLFNGAWGPFPQEILDLRGITDTIILEGITRIIMGLDPLEHWEVVLEDWRQAGGNEMTAAVNRDFR